jgi:protein-S-isoprenylcysteine O-methyltransferase Ste14
VWNGWIFTICLVVRRPLLKLVRRDLWEKMVSPAATEQSRRQRIIGVLAIAAKWSVVVYSVFLPLRTGTAGFYLGLPLTVLGVTLYAIAWINFATTGLNQPVTRGLYRYSRHPMEVTPFITLAGLSIATSSWFLFLLSSAFTALSCLAAVPHEHFWLAKYGDAYRKYLNHTPRWFPHPFGVRYQ